MALMSGVLRARGELGASLALARQAARVGQDGDDRQVWGWGVGEEGRSLCQSGRLEEAASATSKAIELLESIPDYLSVVSAYGDLARCRLRLGRLDEAMSLGETAHRLLVEQRLRAFLCSPVYLARAESLLAAAEADPSTSGPTLKRAGRASAAAVRQGRLDCEALAAAHRCRGTYQWLRGRPRRAVRSWRRSIAVAERIGARYELALTWLEIGSRTGERGYLEDAEQVFSELGDELDLAHVRERLGES
jgi:tetratricopeptide (TPR) repeat protein